MIPRSTTDLLQVSLDDDLPVDFAIPSRGFVKLYPPIEKNGLCRSHSLNSRPVALMLTRTYPTVFD
jgi:hypothetical protein